MNSKIVFGSYVPVKSILHRLDPRIKTNHVYYLRLF